MIENLHPPFNRRDTVEAFENLARKIKPFLHTYNVTIGDDVSGRLPTLVIADLARRKRRELNLPPPFIFLINAGSNLTNYETAEIVKPKIAEIIKTNKDRYKGKVLIVTEYACTGYSIGALVDEFLKQNIKPDLCVLGSNADFSKIRGLENINIFKGSPKHDGASYAFYGFPRLTGVSSTPGSAYSERLELYDDELPAAYAAGLL